MRSAINLYSPRGLAYLYKQAEEHGIGSLEPDDREAVRDYARHHGLPSPRKRKNTPITDSDPTAKPQPETQSEPEASRAAQEQTSVVEPTPEVTAPTESAPEQVQDVEVDDSELQSMCESVIWENIPAPLQPTQPRFRARTQASALRKFGKPGIISSNIKLSSAQSTAYRINAGRYQAWQPKGAYRAYAAHDPAHEGKYCVVVRYVGGEH